MILTKTIQFYQSKEISLLIWKAHFEANYCYNMGIEWRVDKNLSQFDIFNNYTFLNNIILWLKNKVIVNRYSIDQARKAVDLFYMYNKKKLDKIQWNKTKNIINKSIKLTDPQTLFRKKNLYKKQPAFGSFGRPKINKDGSWRLGKICNITPKIPFNYKDIKSYQIVETTKRITKKTKPENRTYELHIQYEYYSKENNNILTTGVDIGVINMITIHNEKETTIYKVPEGKFRYKGDEIDRLKSEQSKRKKGSRKWGLIQRKIRKLSLQKTNQRHDCLRYFTNQSLCNSKNVIAEQLEVRRMVKKGNGKKHLNRIITHGGLGETKDYIKHYSKKHNIKYFSIPPNYTSQKCSECGIIDKKSRNGELYLCIHCGYENHADKNASINIHNNGMEKLNIHSMAAGNVVNKKKDEISKDKVKRTNSKIPLLLEKNIDNNVINICNSQREYNKKIDKTKSIIVKEVETEEKYKELVNISNNMTEFYEMNKDIIPVFHINDIEIHGSNHVIQYMWDDPHS